MSSKFSLALAVAPALLLATAAAAGGTKAQTGIAETASILTDLGNHASALTYWVNGADGVHTVTTVDTRTAGAPTDMIVRFAAVILPGQSQLISVPGPIGAPQPQLRIRRTGDRQGTPRIEVDRIPAPGFASTAAAN